MTPRKQAADEKPEETAAAPAAAVEIGEGDRVKFLWPSNKAIEIVGTVKGVRGDLIDIEFERDGKIVEVEGHVETVHVSELKPALQGDTHRHVGDRG
jgi:signal peptidase I